MEIEEVESEEIRSERQARILNVRKVKSRDAARNRRSKENTQYLELAKLLPFPSSVTSQLDKASIIRLTISFLKYQELTSKAFRRRMDQGHAKHKQNHINGKGASGAFAQLFGEDLGVHLLQALDGFLFCISQEGKFIYISETVTTHLGLSQLDLIGTNAFNIIHPDDQKSFSELLNRNVPNNYHSLPFHAFDDFDAMTSNEMQFNLNQNQETISTFTRMKCALIKRAGCYVKSSGYKVIHVSGKLVPYRNMDRNGFRSYAMVATGQPLPPPTICELKLDTKVFVSRVSMDLKIVFCEGRIHNYMNFKARDVVGLSAYEFYHAKDFKIVTKGHNDCITSGKCVTASYRWINKDGGYVWMQTVGTVIKRHGPFGEESQILCVNYISSEVEGEGSVVHNLQQHFKQLNVTQEEKDPYDDYGLDSRQMETISSNDITSMYSHPKNPDAVMDKEDFIKTIKYDTVWHNNNNNSHNEMRMSHQAVPMPSHPSHNPYPIVPPITHVPVPVPSAISQSNHVQSNHAPEECFDPLDDLGVPFTERIPSLQDALEQEETDRLMAEFMSEPGNVPYPAGFAVNNNNACDSDSVYSDMSPVPMNGNSSPPYVNHDSPNNMVHPLPNFKSSSSNVKNMYPQQQQQQQQQHQHQQQQQHLQQQQQQQQQQQRIFHQNISAQNNIHAVGPRYANNVSNAMFHNNNSPNYYQNNNNFNNNNHHNAMITSSSAANVYNNQTHHMNNPVLNLCPNNLETVVKSEQLSPTGQQNNQQQQQVWKNAKYINHNGGIINGKSVVYLQHPTQYNNICANSVAMEHQNEDSSFPVTTMNNNNNNTYRPEINNIENVSLLKQLENNQNGYLNDISIEQSMYGYPVAPVSQRDYP